MTIVNQLNQDLSRPLDPSASQQEARDKLNGGLHINQHGIKFTPWGTLHFSIRKIVRKKKMDNPRLLVMHTGFHPLIRQGPDSGVLRAAGSTAGE